MPHIVIDACDCTKNMQIIQLHCNVQFSPLYFKSPKCEVNLNQLRDELVCVVERYFPNAISLADSMSDHQFNEKYNNQ